jgi:acyl carrier protein
MTTDKIRLTMATIINGQFNRKSADELGPETRFKEDLKADSLDCLELVMEIEDGFGMSITDEEAERCETIGQAIELIRQKVG